MSDICELCQRNAGRYNMRLRCCKVRLVADMPKHHRESYYQTVREQEGEAALLVLIEEVKKAYQHRKK